MVILAALPGIGRELLVNGNLVKPGNFSAAVNFMGSRIRKVGLVSWDFPDESRPTRWTTSSGDPNTDPRKNLRPAQGGRVPDPVGQRPESADFISGPYKTHWNRA